MRLKEALNNHIYGEDPYLQDALGFMNISFDTLSFLGIDSIDDLLDQDIVKVIPTIASYSPDTWTFGTCYVLESGFKAALYENRYYVPYFPDNDNLSFLGN